MALWGLAVWGGLLGCALLIIKKRLATLVLLISFVCMMVTTINNYVLGSAMEHFGSPGLLIFTALIFLVSLGLWRYARAMQTRGVLK